VQPVDIKKLIFKDFPG